MSSKRPANEPPNLQQASIAEVVGALRAPEHWTRYQAKRELTRRDPQAVADALGSWVRTLDPKLPSYEHHLYEALGAHATIEVVEPRLLKRLLRAEDPRARCYATRIVGRWHDRLDDPLNLLAERVADEHPRVRMEAVVACSAIPAARAMEVAAGVVDQAMDEWIEYAFRQTVRRLKPWWMPAFRRGEMTFARPNQLAAVLNETGGREVLESLKRLADSGDLDATSRSSAIAAILAVGGPHELRAYGLDSARFKRGGRYDAAMHARALMRMIEIARFRKVRPSGELATSLTQLLDQRDMQLRGHALTLAGIWNVAELQETVIAHAGDDRLPASIRASAFEAMASMRISDSRELLVAYAQQPNTPVLRSAAIQSLALIDVAAAAQQAAKLFVEIDPHTLDASAVLASFLNRSGGAEALALALQSQDLGHEQASQLVRSLFSLGRSDKVLLDVLIRSIGTDGRTPDYSEEHVSSLVREAKRHGEPKRGAALFTSMACASCHKVAGVGGNIGPDLTSIGTTLSPERIVEELLWPDRQIKEGFSMVQVITVHGKIHQGYERTTKETAAAGDVVIEDLATGKQITIARHDIEEKQTAGSAMPTGLAAMLSESQLSDLIQYLSELGRIQ